MKIGFPETCFESQTFDFGKTGLYNEPTLDVISAILTMGFYPNVCYHKEKRKVVFMFILLFDNYCDFFLLNIEIHIKSCS